MVFLYIIIDVLLILLLILFLYSGYKQGFIKSGMGFLCFAVSFVLASILSPIISTYIYDNFISHKLISDINSIINENSFGAAGKAKAIMENLPKLLTNSFDRYGISTSCIFEILIKERDPAEEIVKLIKPIISKFLDPIILILVTTVSTFVSSFILKKFRKVTKNLFIGKVDSILGLAFGSLKYAVLIFIVSLSLKTLIPLYSTNITETVNTAIDKTIVARYIVNLDVSNLKNT